MKHRIYSVPNSEQQILITTEVLEFFSAYRQQGAESESGGILFAEFDFPMIRIIEASPPQPSDKRWRTLFVPNRIFQRQLIKQRFKKGHHFVGEWHTHPQGKPSPSTLDLGSMTDSFLKSKHELNYFIMIIIGNDIRALELWVSVHNSMNYYQLKENKD
jgi:integrative and conjugative element protein (TIGR02256 family)